MNNSTALEVHEPVLTFSEKVDILFNEIDMAIKWSRPSILFAVYCSGSTLSKAKAELEDRLTHLNQKTHVVEISGKNKSDLSTEIFQLPRLSHSVFFIDDINCDNREENNGFFSDLRRHLERFIDNRVRVIFWLSEEQVPLFATNAVECWILRHHVVEFQDDPLHSNPLLETLESTWQEVDENTFLDGTSSSAISEIINNPEKVEADFFHGNLILMLGILYWRKGNAKDALKFVNVALNIAKKISHQTLETQCQDALVLIQSDPKNITNASAAVENDIPFTPEQAVKSMGSPAPSEPDKIDAQIDSEAESDINNLGLQERGTKMQESEQIIDQKTSTDWNNLGNKFLKSGSYNDAIKAFTRAIELAPELSWPYIRNLASAHYQKGKISGIPSSGKTMEQEIREDDEEMEAIEYFNQESLPPARRGDDQPVESVDQKPVTLFTSQKDISTSSPQSELSSNLPTNLKQTNLAQQPEGTSGADIPVVKPTIENSTSAIDIEAPHPVPAGFKAIPKVFESGPKNAFDWNALGNSYAGRQDYEKAIYAYKKSIELDPGFGQAYCNLGSVLYQSGKYESAVLILKKSLDYMVSPEEKSLSWNRLGDVYRRLRDYGNAMAAYQKAGQSNFETNPVLNRTRISLMDHVAVG